MEGADVAVAYMDRERGFATDYNVTAMAPVSIRAFINYSTVEGNK